MPDHSAEERTHNMSPQIICVGDLCCDLIISYGRMREALNDGDISKQTADSLLVSMQCGGSVGNVARHLGRLQKNPVFITPLKRDALGEYLASEMEKAGADMRWAAPSSKSNMYCIAVLDEKGERTMFSFVPPWADYPRFDEASFAAVPHFGSEILFTSGMAILDDEKNNASVLDFFRERRNEGALTVFDLNVRAESYGYEGERRRAMEEMISLSDIVLGSGSEEFFQVTGTTDIKSAARILLNKMYCNGLNEKPHEEDQDSGRTVANEARCRYLNGNGNKAVIARDGGNPIYVLVKTESGAFPFAEHTADNTIKKDANLTPYNDVCQVKRGSGRPDEREQLSGFFVPVKPVKPVSTLGAGDCFDARFVSALADGERLDNAVRLASDYAGVYISGS